jgi:N-acetyl-1-D-myo-inositol-2-amino-2-deoxy-alpha-D-glucopyranoside deacetylase
MMPERRLLLVHAHPDDESIGTGATIAAYAAAGAAVTLVTCTLGEYGEIIPPGLAHLAADAGGGLGGYRIGELAAACAALGVTDQRFLGGAGRWRDSGMMGLPSNDEPGSFWRAPVDEAAALLAAVVSEVRPQVMVSYDANGNYGHPDHIQAHRVAWRARELAARPGPDCWQVAKFYATAMPLSALAEAIKLDQAAVPPGFIAVPSVDALPFGVPDDQVTTEIDASGQLPAKLAAMAAHATQISVAGEYYALSDHIGLRASGREYYTLVAGRHGPGTGPFGRENDLFAGL